MPLVTPQIYSKPNLVTQTYRGTSVNAYPLSHSSDRQDACPIEVLIELASLNEFIILNVFLHLLPRGHKVVVLTVHLVLSPWTSRICRGEWSEFILATALVFSMLSRDRCWCALDSRGTQEPNLWGNSEMRSSFTLSFIGPKIITGLV